MEIQPAQPSSSKSPAAYPPWVLLHESGWGMADGDGSSTSSTAYAKTMVTARASTGERIKLYLELAEPPTVQSAVVCTKLPNGNYPYSTIIASHGDSMLIKVQEYMRQTVDIFVYNAGAAAADPPRPPSLSLLPPCNLTVGNGWPSKLRSVKRFIGMHEEPELHHATGMLRRGEDEIVVAELWMVGESWFDPGPKTAELFLFRSGEWSVMRPQIISYDSRDFEKELSSSWITDTVVPVADRLLCWVDFHCGVLLCNVFEETPGLQLIPLPKDPCYGRASHRNVCVTAGGAVLKFVNIVPRCCCGGKGAIDTGCLRSLNAYTINTWTLRVSDMEWVKDGMFHNTELWGLDVYYEYLPHLVPTYPVVSMDEPHTISFLLSDSDENCHEPWLIVLDMKSKTIRLATQDFGGLWPTHGPALIPSSVSYYLNSSPSCSSNVTSTVDDDQAKDHDASNLMAQSSCQSFAEPAVQASEILAALQEIPSYGLDDDMLKAAYRILSHGNGNRCRYLLSVPMNLRKDWLLMEIKTSEA